MIPAKKLLPEAEETAASDQQETKYQSDSQLHNLVKLLIIMLLSYVIIFM